MQTLPTLLVLQIIKGGCLNLRGDDLKVGMLIYIMMLTLYSLLAVLMLFFYIGLKNTQILLSWLQIYSFQFHNAQSVISNMKTRHLSVEIRTDPPKISHKGDILSQYDCVAELIGCN